MGKGVTRRGFLGTLAASAGALAALGATGCSPAGDSEDSGSESSSSDNGVGEWAQSLNVDLASTLPGNTAEEVEISDTKDCDVLVIGAGCSGTNTATRAGQLGLKVILVEKSEQIGGSSLESWAPSVPNSSYAKAAGVTTDIDTLVSDWVADSHWRVDAAMIRQLVSNAGEAVDWMSDDLGWEFTYLGMDADITTLPDYDLREPLYEDGLSEYVEGNGEVLTLTTAKHLITDDSGAVTGAVVVDNDGNGTQINAQAVVIATGGYGGNTEMVKASFGFDGVFAGLPQNIGEGLEMAWQVGAQKPQNFGGQMLHQTLAKATDSLVNELDAFPAKYPMILAYVANVLNVGPTGARFRDESLVLDSVPSANSSVYQGNMHFVIVSQSQVEVLEEEGLAGLGVDYDPGLPPEYAPDYELDTPWDDLEDVLDTCVDEGSAYKGDTAEELAEAAGMDVDTFVNQLEEYNEFCESGSDTQFGKAKDYLYPMGDGPYWAIYCEENNLCSWGGLLVNTDYQVLDDNRIPISGLYAVGNECGGNLYNDTYVGFGYGMANAITSGYLCGSKLGESLGSGSADSSAE